MRVHDRGFADEVKWKAAGKDLPRQTNRHAPKFAGKTRTVRPTPVYFIQNSTLHADRKLRSKGRNEGGGTRMPPRPCTGSTKMAPTGRRLHNR